MKILVVGAAGKTGREVVAHAVKAGHEVTAFVHRDAGDVIAGVQVRSGDASDLDVVEAAVRGQDAVINTVGGRTPYRRTTLETAVAETIVAAMTRNDVRRLVVTSSVGVGDSIGNSPVLLKLLLRTFLRGSTADKTNMESVVRGSALEWVIARPAVLNQKPAIGSVGVFAAAEREKVRSITRSDLADFLISQLASDDHLRSAITIANP